LSKKPASSQTLKELAQQFGVSHGAVLGIRSGKNHRNGYSKTNRTVLTAAQVSQIREWRPPRPSATDLAIKYAVSASTILNIWHGRYFNWRLR
jgi:hypothetical protein